MAKPISEENSFLADLVTAYREDRMLEFARAHQMNVVQCHGMFRRFQLGPEKKRKHIEYVINRRKGLA